MHKRRHHENIYEHQPSAAHYNLTKSSEEGYKADTENGPLPRSVSRPNTYLLLDGEWRFALDPQGLGVAAGWQHQHDYSGTAHWPGSVEAQLAKAAQNNKDWQDKVIAWYERDFRNPGKLGAAGETRAVWLLTFGACGYETCVWLNGKLLSTVEGEDMHIGEYTSFSYEISEELLLPVNRLTVRIVNSMDADTTRGKQESHVYKRGGIWYQTYTGAVRSVWLEPVERNRLRSRVGIVSVVEDNLVRINLITHINDPGRYTILLKVFNRKQSSDAPVATDEFSMMLESGQRQQRVVIEVPGAQLWSPESPHLYRLIAQLVDSKGYAASIEAHFGLRKIEARGNKVYLNNKPIYLDGILYQPGTASYEQIKKHMYAMKALGCNLVRIHIAGVDPRIYKLADKIGMLLWVEVPSPHQSNERSRANHRAELMRMLALIETHPSIVIWSLYNEDWGAQDIDSNEATRAYIIGMYHFMQINHPQFLVVDNDGWKHISLEGRLKSDLLTAHLYTPDARRWRELLDSLSGGKTEGVAAYPLTVGDPFFYRRQVPLIVSEWGGFGFPDYGGPKDADERAAQIARYKKELRLRPIAGDVYTQATNIEEERNGLIDFEPASCGYRRPCSIQKARQSRIRKTLPTLQITDTMNDLFLSCDWGTSNFRLRLVSLSDLSILGEVSSDNGVSEILKRWQAGGDKDEERRRLFYTQVLREHVGQLKSRTTQPLDGLPVIISGMATSSIGLANIPYQKIPIPIDGSGLKTQSFEPVEASSTPSCSYPGTKRR